MATTTHSSPTDPFLMITRTVYFPTVLKLPKYPGQHLFNPQQQLTRRERGVLLQVNFQQTRTLPAIRSLQPESPRSRSLSCGSGVTSPARGTRHTPLPDATAQKQTQASLGFAVISSLCCRFVPLLGTATELSASSWSRLDERRDRHGQDLIFSLEDQLQTPGLTDNNLLWQQPEAPATRLNIRVGGRRHLEMRSLLWGTAHV